MFHALYSGQCPTCGNSFAAGDPVHYLDGHSTPSCGACIEERYNRPTVAELRAPKPTCPVCHLELPTTGLCCEG